MKSIKRILTIMLLIVIFFTLLNLFFTIESLSATQKISSDINSIDNSKYPGIKSQIQQLKKAHPNWTFKILYTGINWNTVIANEYVGHGSSPRNLVPANQSNYAGDWICAICKNNKYDSGSWVCASESAIKYMMDPRNSINESDVFQFQELSYSGYDGNTINSMVRGTFLNNTSCKNAIKEASKQSNVSPYYIVARILQEQGTSGTALTKGKGYNNQYIGVYNVFNIGATGSGKDKVILNGLKKAKEKGWTSLEKSIKGGTQEIAKNYIARGQNTLYLQKFDVDNSDNSLYYHQYMQNILAAQNEGTSLRRTYNTVNTINGKYTFIIPVYENMPTSVCTRPSTQTSGKVTTDIVKVNVNSSIKMRSEPNGSKTVGYLYKDEIVTRLEKAKNKVDGTYWDKVMKSSGTIGYVARQTSDNEKNYKKYLVEIESENTNNNQQPNNISNDKIQFNKIDKTITVIPETKVSDIVSLLGNQTIIKNSDKKQLSSSSMVTTNTNVNGEYTVVVLGDINGDGKIDTADLLMIQKHLLSIKKITNNVKMKSADINRDGKINTADLLKIQKKLLGISNITF